MENEHDTPANAGLGRDADPGAIKVANLGLIFTELGRTCAALARRVDEVSGVERAALFAQLGAELREQADLSHDTARYFEGISRGGLARAPDPPTTNRRRVIMSSKVKHIVGIVLTIATIVATEVFGPSGVWAHVAAGGTVVALLTSISKAIGPAS